MKAFKRNAVIVTVLVFVCVAVYLNWSYNKRESEAAQLSAGQTENGGDGLYYVAMNGGDDAAAETGEPSPVPEGTGEADNAQPDAGAAEPTDDRNEYFSTVRLNREKARDAATQTLMTISDSGEESESAAAAMQKMMDMAESAMVEAEIEGLILAKGYADCVVYISDDGVTVTVATEPEGLTQAGAAQIADIVTGETGCAVSDMKIFEIK